MTVAENTTRQVADRFILDDSLGEIDWKPTAKDFTIEASRSETSHPCFGPAGCCRTDSHPQLEEQYIETLSLG